MGKGRSPTDADRLRQLAEECRNRAFETNAKEVREQWLTLAGIYDEQAEVKQSLHLVNKRRRRSDAT
jgi:hypothetical protein